MGDRRVVDVVAPRPNLEWVDRRVPHRGLFIRQNVDWADIILDQDIQANTYQVKGFPEEYHESDGALSQHDFKGLPLSLVAVEHSNVCCRMLCGPYRPFELSFNEADGRELLRLKRELKWPPHLFCGLFPICGCFLVPQEAEVLTPEGFKLGSVVEAHHNCVCGPSWFLDIRDCEGQTRYVAKAELIQQCCCFAAPNCCCRRFSFEILTPAMDDTGAAIRNVWPGCNFRGLLSRADNLTVTFPDDATREDRALLLAAAILADYVFFEKGNNNKGKAGVADGIAQPLLA